VNGAAAPDKVLPDMAISPALPETLPERIVPAAPTGTQSRFTWLALGIAVAAALALYIPVIAGMASDWIEFPSLSHGFAVPLISAYLLWNKRRRLAETPIRGSLAGLVLVVLALGMLVIGSLGGESFVARLSLPLTLLGLVLFLMGTRVARHTWVAVAYLMFMIPLPYVTLKALTYQSRLFDAGLTATALGWLGIPVLRDGVMLQLPNMTLEVADECSSVPAIAALLALGAAYAQLQARPTWIRAVLTIGAAPLGLLSNIIRLILTSLSAYYLGPIALNNVIHKFNGTTVFLATVILLVLLDTLLTRLWKRGASS
jgi:exosortase